MFTKSVCGTFVTCRQFPDKCVEIINWDSTIKFKGYLRMYRLQSLVNVREKLHVPRNATDDEKKVLKGNRGERRRRDENTNQQLATEGGNKSQFATARNRRY